MVDVSLLTTQLAEARAQYHKLVTGQMARVFVDQNGERVEFTAASKADLYNYIVQLQAQIQCPTADPARTRPLRPYF